METLISSTLDYVNKYIVVTEQWDDHTTVYNYPINLISTIYNNTGGGSYILFLYNNDLIFTVSDIEGNTGYGNNALGEKDPTTINKNFLYLINV